MRTVDVFRGATLSASQERSRLRYGLVRMLVQLLASTGGSKHCADLRLPTWARHRGSNNHSSNNVLHCGVAGAHDKGNALEDASMPLSALLLTVFSTWGYGRERSFFGFLSLVSSASKRCTPRDYAKIGEMEAKRRVLDTHSPD